MLRRKARTASEPPGRCRILQTATQDARRALGTRRRPRAWALIPVGHDACQVGARRLQVVGHGVAHDVLHGRFRLVSGRGRGIGAVAGCATSAVQDCRRRVHRGRGSRPADRGRAGPPRDTEGDATRGEGVRPGHDRRQRPRVRGDSRRLRSRRRSRSQPCRGPSKSSEYRSSARYRARRSTTATFRRCRAHARRHWGSSGRRRARGAIPTSRRGQASHFPRCKSTLPGRDGCRSDRPRCRARIAQLPQRAHALSGQLERLA